MIDNIVANNNDSNNRMETTSTNMEWVVKYENEGSVCFASSVRDGWVTFDFNEAKHFSNIGDAMRTAASYNDSLHPNKPFKVVRL